MIYSLHYRIGFVHIPKTGGHSIRAALRAIDPGGWFECCDHFHMPAREIRRRVLGDLFERLRWFAVTRHPLEAIWSSYCRTAQVAADPNRRGYPAAYCDYLDRFETYRDFEAYARGAWIGPGGTLQSGGFWRTWCCPHPGESDLAIRPLPFIDLREHMAGLFAEWGLPVPELPRLNASRRPLDPDAVSAGLRRAIMDHCHEDAERFGYR